MYIRFSFYNNRLTGSVFLRKVLGVTVDNYSGIATFLSIATFAFMTIIFGTISLIGLAGVPLAVLLLFFHYHCYH